MSLKRRIGLVTAAVVVATTMAASPAMAGSGRGCDKTDRSEDRCIAAVVGNGK